MSSAATLQATAKTGGGAHPASFIFSPLQRRYRSAITEFSPSFLHPSKLKMGDRTLAASAHLQKNDNDTFKTKNATDVQEGNVEQSQQSVLTTDTSSDYNSAITTETQLDYAGAGTLGDIMSLPDEDDEDGKTPSSDVSSAKPFSIDDEMTGPPKAQQQQQKDEKYAMPTTQPIPHPHWTSNLTESEVSYPPPPSSPDQEKERNTSTDTTQTKPKEPSPTKSGLVTSAGGTLTSRFAHISPQLNPLDRIALTANGNLQRIFSSYYDSPVFVHVDFCAPRRKKEVQNSVEGGAVRMRMGDGGVPTFLASSSTTKNGKMKKNNYEDSLVNGSNDEFSGKHDNDEGESITLNGSSVVDKGDKYENSPTVWDRIVHLSVHDQRFCTATSVITVYSQKCEQLVESGKVGLGQLFRYLDKLPTFELLDAGRTEDGGLWRRYELSCAELKCDVTEAFVPNAWDIDGLSPH